VVTTLNPQGAVYAEHFGIPVLRGDASRRHTLEEAGIRRARMVVIADDDPEMTARIASVARSLNNETTVVVRADDDDEGELARTGADLVVTGPRASARALGDVVVREYYGGAQLDALHDDATVDTEHIVRFVPAPSGCRHYDHIHPVLPSAPGCEECLQLGDRWVHLRICTECGHVGCCDDSPHRHARRHASETHPIVRSLEPGERWGWCFVDELELDP
jgi:CPA2 family monovalent cation:H+ antiporter-2